jgi:hypothetical protein
MTMIKEMGRDKVLYLPRRLYDMIAVVYAHKRRYTHKILKYLVGSYFERGYSCAKDGLWLIDCCCCAGGCPGFRFPPETKEPRAGERSNVCEA